jgi:hypothetical protein
MVFHIPCTLQQDYIVSAPLLPGLEDGWFEDLVGWLVGVVWLFGWFGILAPASTNQSIHHNDVINQSVVASDRRV